MIHPDRHPILHAAFDDVTALLVRMRSDDNQSLGVLYVFGTDASLLMRCVTLEPAWLGNRQNVSCIPPGTYRLAHRVSERFDRHLHVQSLTGGEVAGRSLILLHAGNFRRNTRGCVLPGRAFAQIDGHGGLDVTSSRSALHELLDHIPREGARLVVISPESC